MVMSDLDTKKPPEISSQSGSVAIELVWGWGVWRSADDQTELPRPCGLVTEQADMKAKPVDHDERATREADVDAHCLDAPFGRVEDDDGRLPESHIRDSVNNELLESVRDDPIANVDQLVAARMASAPYLTQARDI
jgi:hypothetical protein